MAPFCGSLFLVVIAHCFFVSSSLETYRLDGLWQCPPFAHLSLRGAHLPFSGKLTKCSGNAVLKVSQTATKEKDLRLVYGSLTLHDDVNTKSNEVRLGIVGMYNFRKRHAGFANSLKLSGKDVKKIQDVVRNKQDAAKFAETMKLINNATRSSNCQFKLSLNTAFGEAMGTLESRACSTSVQLHVSTIRVKNRGRRRFYYGILSSLVLVIQFVVIMRQISAINTPEKAKAISIVSIALLFGVTLVYAVFNIRAFILTSIIGLACACAYAVWIVFLMNSRREPNRPNAILESVSVVVALLLGFILFYFIVRVLHRISLFLPAIVVFSFFLPQIYKSQTEEHWNALLNSFVIVTGLTTLFFPLYMFAWPSNFIGIQPRPWLAVFILLYVAAQCAYIVWKNIGNAPTSEYREISGGD